jgi:CheY-like chemotaxis protein
MQPQLSELARGARVLVIDDEPLVTLTLAKVLTAEGLQVDVANDAAEGLRRAQEVCPSLVIVDLHMPLVDGWGFIEAFRKMPACVDVPVILATGSEEIAPVSPQRAGLGVVLLLPKPFDLNMLITTVSSAIRGHDLSVLDHDL